MSENPYRPPNHVDVEAKPNSMRTSFSSILWILFLLIPSIAVLTFRAGHLAQFLERPSGDTILSRASIILRTPMEPFLLVSFVGCLLSTFRLHVKLPWKFWIIVAWFPLVVLQFAVLVVILALLGERWGDI